MLRVRQLLSHVECRATLRRFLPKEATIVPTFATGHAPREILQLFSTDQCYSQFGIITEHFLQQPVLDHDVLAVTIHVLTEQHLPRGEISVELSHYLTHCQHTQYLMSKITPLDSIHYETAIEQPHLVGHPDGRTLQDVFEVKTTTWFRDQWTQFMLQLFAYGAMDSRIERVHLVLPLQAVVWSYPLSRWTHRAQYLSTLVSYAERYTRVQIDPYQYLTLMMLPIGAHLPKKGELSLTLQTHASHGRPWQVFLGGPKSTHIAVKPADLTRCRQLISERHLDVYIHASYLLNICKSDDYVTEHLIKALECAQQMGSKGVVVHCGHQCELTHDQAMQNMTNNLRRALSAIKQECCLLVETPAGQGTEVLSHTPEEMIDYLQSVDDPRLGLCLDTCHVFAMGIQPSVYMRSFLERSPNLIKLVHFNESAKPLGSRVDRHECLRNGLIGVEEMLEVAYMAISLDLPLVNE
jgi:deoxyribonuclease IV